MGAEGWGFRLQLQGKGPRGQPFVKPERSGFTIAHFNADIRKEMVFEGEETFPEWRIIWFSFRRIEWTVM